MTISSICSGPLILEIWGQIFILDLAVFVSSTFRSAPTDFGLPSEPQQVSSSSHSPRYNQYPSIPQSPSDSSPRCDTAFPLKFLAQPLCIPFLIIRPFS